jgi:hypothetical protein
VLLASGKIIDVVGTRKATGRIISDLDSDYQK